MAKVKVRVLYPTAFAAMGINVDGKDEVTIEQEQADALYPWDFAEPVKASKATKTETAVVKLEADA